ncbi:Hypothetical protein A7982_07463 [Minicystis rosea]|nr:Hypothetical protein A7982_07463 [Minicystis rosea]
MLVDEALVEAITPRIDAPATFQQSLVMVPWSAHRKTKPM